MKPNHIIQKVFVEITVNTKEKAYKIKNNISSFLSIDVFPEIEKYIDALEYKIADHTTLQIPKLELNLDIKNSELNTELKDKITQLFKDELSEASEIVEVMDQKTAVEGESEIKAYLINDQEKITKTFIYFLENGSMPWWISDMESTNFLDSKTFTGIILSSNFQKKIIPVLVNQNVRNRMVNQLSDIQIAQLCQEILKNKELEIKLETDALQHISKLNASDRVVVWNLVLNMINEYLNKPNNNLREYLLQQLSTATLAGLSMITGNHKKWKTIVEIFPFIKEDEIFENIKSNVSSQHENSEIPLKNIIHTKNAAEFENLNQTLKDLNNNDEQYIKNAGLILIHPFIKTFFEHCKLFDSKNQKLINPELCAHLLHYIATGNTNAEEHEMIFEKFLCNIPVNQTINRHIKLSRKHKAQAKNVIESVQHNWAPMKNSSVALLQNEFFQRPGKLVITDHEYNLTVERKTQDILLDKLAWGIGLVKLPWHEKFMLVNW